MMEHEKSDTRQRRKEDAHAALRITYDLRRAGVCVFSKTLFRSNVATAAKIQFEEWVFEMRMRNGKCECRPHTKLLAKHKIFIFRISNAQGDDSMRKCWSFHCFV